MYDTDPFCLLTQAERKKRQSVQEALTQITSTENARRAERQKRREDRLNAFLEKARTTNSLPESYEARRLLGIYSFALREISYSRSYGECALIETAKLGNVKAGEYLLDRFLARPNASDEDGQTALYHAIRRKRLGYAEMLLQHGAQDVSKGDTPLIHACATGFDKAIPLFAKYEVDLNKPKKHRKWNRYFLGWKTYHIHPICVAALYGQDKVVSTLLKYGAEIDVEYIPGMTLRSVLESENNFEPKVKKAFAPALTAKKITEQKANKSMDNQHTR